ncbi:MAG: peptide chain release factor 3, partial [Bauldia sp.]|nr:peptide chain release factor 3 [Bauldia sp.]
MNEISQPAPAPETHAPAPAGSYAARRTFAIISHPDAGKTTLTEHLLVAGGAIHIAGNVKARGQARRAHSDWMEIEQKRGISVTSSVMTFEKDGITFNLLDTPGHADFSEDTYRTLTAVDSAIMVLDAAKGIESQTLKLFEVCRLRNIPIITFINKVDREGRHPLELMDEIADKLALDVSPVTWPVGMGVDFRGVIDFVGEKVILPDGHDSGLPWNGGDPDLTRLPHMADHILGPVLESLDLARSALPRFDLRSFREGHLTPVFFGSALKGVAVAELLKAVAEWAPGPQPQAALPHEVRPEQREVTGFVFKVQANMDPNHRDRVAFVRLCSGTFRRGMKLRNVRSGKDLTIGNPVLFMARERDTADDAAAGDIVGIPNHGTLSVGDTLTEGSRISFLGIPDFAPEILRRVRLGDVTKSKQLQRALTDLAEEGVAQAFRPMIGNAWLVGVVGALQLDVMKSRVAREYNIAIDFEPTEAESARWLASDDPAKLKAFLS